MRYLRATSRILTRPPVSSWALALTMQLDGLVSGSRIVAVAGATNENDPSRDPEPIPVAVDFAQAASQVPRTR